MDMQFKENIINSILKWLKQGNYVRFTNLYTGNYLDAINSKDKKYLSKENIMFVTKNTIVKYLNKDNKEIDIPMYKCFIDLFDERIFYYIGIHAPEHGSKDKDDWKIFLNIGEYNE